MGVRWDLDFEDQLPARARTGAERGVGMALEYLLAEARTQVPIEEGTLERSGATQQDGLRGTVSFDTPYAVIQHEDMSLRHDAGRSAKYLERPMAQEGPQAMRIIAAQIQRAIGGGH